MSMGRAARKDAAEDASWRRLPQRVFWRFYPAFEGLLVAARSAVVFLAVGAPAPAATSEDRASPDARLLPAPVSARPGRSRRSQVRLTVVPAHSHAIPVRRRRAGKVPAKAAIVEALPRVRRRLFAFRRLDARPEHLKRCYGC